MRFHSVSVAYGATTVLDSLDLTVLPGEVMALLGPSGSGKTTALRAVAGFATPARGRVYIGGEDVTGLPPHRRGIGMVVQQYALFPHMRVSDNVAFGLKAHKVPRAEIPDRVREALRMTGMEDYARRYPRELSGGQQQRVAIARALAIRPRVLLLDEPLSALDAQLRSGMLAELARLHRELPDVSILYVTHDQVEALTLADRIAVMRDARLVSCGTPQELYREPGNDFTATFLGGANLLPVTVQAHAPDGRAEVDHRGTTLLVTAPDSVSPGVELLACVRPHHLSLTEHPTRNCLRGKVAELQWRGATHRLYLDIGPEPLVADVAELREPPRVGDTVTVSFAPQDAVLLPAKPGDGLPTKPAHRVGRAR
ncbi:ABC transporter ATP-binding protein [Streptomyces sp. GSL17-111]|uniref:ABC transporter ATP-binding protein n=1 Tax=Streptomyces sp. GSL17-111 TaxID=3121596 RepID=UPI0030F3F862